MMKSQNEVKMCAFCENPANLHGVCDECLADSLDVRESEKVDVWALSKKIHVPSDMDPALECVNASVCPECGDSVTELHESPFGNSEFLCSDCCTAAVVLDN